MKNFFLIVVGSFTVLNLYGNVGQIYKCNKSSDCKIVRESICKMQFAIHKSEFEVWKKSDSEAIKKFKQKKPTEVQHCKDSGVPQKAVCMEHHCRGIQ